MSESFDIVLSKPLAPNAIATAIADLIPPGLRVDVRSDVAHLPDEPGAVCAVTRPTDDPAWPCVLDVLVCRPECGLGPYPDLRIADVLWARFAADAVCGTYPFAGDFDPHDPYWSLACVGGRWYVASTVNARFMSGVPLPDEGVRLVRPVAVPE